MEDNKTPKVKEAFANIMHKTSDAGKKAATEVKKGAQSIYTKVKQDSYNRRMRKYKPLFLEEFESAQYKIPNIIKIVDDAVRRDIDVCEGAIGWTDKHNDTEVLYLYDETIKDGFIKKRGIEFLPNPMCDQIYYMDTFDKKKFIQVDTIFERAHGEKLAELERIAYSLGAKSCLIEIEESSEEHSYKENNEIIKSSTNISANAQCVDSDSKKDVDIKRYSNDKKSSSMHRSGKARTYFNGNDIPKRPTLKWFANDDSIKLLIDMRCSDRNSIQSRTLELEGSMSATMSHKAACVIDSIIDSDTKSTVGRATVKNNKHSDVSLVSKHVKESNRKLIFDIEF